MLESIQKIFNTYSWFDAKFLKRELSKWHGSVLDVGCGNGRLKSLLPAGSSYTGIDLHGKVADYKVDLSKEQFPFTDESFDFAVCNAVLEHVENPEFVDSEIRRALKPKGILYISVPFLQPYHPDPEDYRRFTQKGLIDFLEDRGFKTVRTFEIFGSSVVIEYLTLFELIQFIKSPYRWLNPIRYIQLCYLLPIYFVSRIFNIFFVRLFQYDHFSSPGAKVLAQKI